VGLWGKRDDMVVHETDPYNAEPPRHGLAGRPLTPLDSFYSRNHGPVPDLDPTTWRCQVDGLVERDLELSLAELQDSFEHQQLTATLQCAGNRRAGFLQVRDIPGEDPWGSGATSTAEWTGVRLADVLTAAGVRPAARHVAFAAPDVSQLAVPPQPYGGSVAIDKAMAGEVLLAWAMNGETLPAAHGAPVRVVVPGFIGARSVKWLQRITAQHEPSDNYFQATAYRLLPADADPSKAGAGDGLSLSSIALNSDILSLDDGDTVDAGSTEITGYAFAGDGRGVARVEVSLDRGATWVQAVLDEPVSPWSWRLWRATLDLPAGPLDIVVRAWDTSAALQPELAEQLWNPKGYVNNSWAHIRITAR
jgi:sulfite oxidase